MRGKIDRESMVTKAEEDEARVVRWQKPPGWVPILMGILALPLMIMDDRSRGWIFPVGWAAISLAFGAVGFPTFWREVWFWLSIAAAAVLQIPILWWMAPYLHEHQLGYNVALGMVELLLVVAIVNFVQPKNQMR